jgi:NCS1 nucleoside transporter family
MATETASGAPPGVTPTGIERWGIEPVAEHERPHRRLSDNFTLWLSANLVVSTVALGALAIPVFRLGFVQALGAIVLFNVLGTLPVAFFATLGPRLGLRQMTISRYAFGWTGAKIMAFFNVVACIGWSAVGTLLAAEILHALSGGKVPVAAGVLAVALLTTLVSIYGYHYVHRYERYAWMPMAVVFLIVLAIILPRFAPPHALARGRALLGDWISFGGVVFGAAVGWSSYAADYTVHQPVDASRRRIFLLTFAGIALPCALLQILGLMITGAGYPPSAVASGGGTLVGAVLAPLGTAGALLLAVLAFGMVGNNIPNDYSLGLSMQVLGRPFQKVPRMVWTLLGAISYVTIALVASGHFDALLTNFLLVVAYWLGPWSVILILEHGFRRGRYEIAAWDDPRRLPSGWAALVAMAAGFVGVVLGASQALFTGPVARWLDPPHGMDLGFELGVVAAALVYTLLRPLETRIDSGSFADA